MDEIVEKITEPLAEFAFNKPWDSLSLADKGQCSLHAEWTLKELKSLGFVQLAKDQSLPVNPYISIVFDPLDDDDYDDASEKVYSEAQQDMITPKDGYAFRKVKVE